MVKATPEQPFIGVWYHDNNLPPNQQHKMKVYLNRTFYYYRIFIVEKDFYEYLDKERLAAKIFLIISVPDSLDSLVKLTVPPSEKFEKVYIFLSRKTIAPDYPIIINMDNLFEQISNDIDEIMNIPNRAENILYTDLEPITTFHIDNDLPALSVVNSELSQIIPIRHLSKQSLRFMSYLIMRNILIQKSYNKDDLIEMCASSRDLHQNDKVKLKNIDKLQMNYDEEEVIRYYTTPSWFLFRTVNEVCGTETMEQIYKFRIYIRDLHNKLDQVGEDETQKELIKPFIQTLYRGILIAGSVLQQLMDNKGGLVCMNGFLSTTTHRDVALKYSGHLVNTDPRLKSTLFILQIDQKVNQPYAHIGMYSDVRCESEVLFSLGTIWRIKSITHDKDLCTIELTSCEELDLELDRLPEKYTDGNATFISLGDILHELGDENEAEWCYRKMLDPHPEDDETTGILYYKIGMIQFEKKLYFEAFRNLFDAASLLRQLEDKQIMTTSSRSIYKYCDELPLLKIYNNIGVIHEKNGKFKEAAEHYKQALKNKSSDTEQVIAYRNFGLLHFRLGNYNAAKEHHEKALRLTEVNDICSQEFRKYLKRINDYLDCVADNEEHKHKKQKTTN
jgi:uncharacterized protein YqfB (UPF0267 family)